MIAADTSVVVAAFAAWHEGHEAARVALRRRPRLPSHALLESFAVLTRLPPPHRAEGDLVVEFIARRFPEPPLTLPAGKYRALLDDVVRAGLRGGSVYDALIAATAGHAKATLLTRDVRAIPVYEALGVRHDLVR